MSDNPILKYFEFSHLPTPPSETRQLSLNFCVGVKKRLTQKDM